MPIRYRLLALSAILVFTPPLGTDPVLRGYDAASSRTEREWEAKFQALPSPDSLREYMRRLSARPHHLGSPYDRDNAEWILARFKSWGLPAEIESFDVLFPTPRERIVELVGPTRFRASLQEPALAVDGTSGQQREQLPTFNAYSIDGDVTAPLVYVNYGTPADYDSLEARGISVKGAIVIARYGASWRGIKPKVAGEHGAVGCIIYSDPNDDGYHAGEVYPDGPFRNQTGVQRGSVMDMPLHPGDPLTPGVGAVAGAHRLAREDAATITKIPVLPISYGDAQPLLAAIRGQPAPRSWQGGLPLTYHIGPGPAQVHLRVRSDWNMVKLYDVIVRIPGSTAPDEWVIRGNHHDAWVNGAEDPISGQVALMEEARALGDLLRQGWRPRRTIIYAAWDGEEEGLLGSTEWVEAHADELRTKAVAYFNTDSNGRGYLGMGGSHSLERFINDVARDITDPETGLSVWKRAQAQQIRGSNQKNRDEARDRGDLRIGALGSGSDFTPFLQHLGIASLNLGYGGEDDGGIYHSIYDDFRWFTTFSDSSFVYGRALAQTVGTGVMRLADAPMLPLEFKNQAETFSGYLDELKTLLKERQETVRERNRQLEDGVYAAVEDPRRPAPRPDTLEVPPYLNFAPLENAIDRLTRSAGRFEEMHQNLGDSLTAGIDFARINGLLIRTERALTDSAGLPGRPWFQHQIYAPGFYTGYGVKTVPGVREAIEQRHWDEAQTQIGRASAVLQAEAALLDQAAKLLSRD
ncbi:MAG TPA: M28 family metallopeptidase [Gemmatimonadales bacterium]|nr:M28 family metallopeptidase [Gemmatimonadales bacterium]